MGVLAYICVTLPVTVFENTSESTQKSENFGTNLTKRQFNVIIKQVGRLMRSKVYRITNFTRFTMDNIQNKEASMNISAVGISDKLSKLLFEIFTADKDGKINLEKIVFSNKRLKSLEYNKVMLRPILLGGQLKFQAEYTFPKKVTHSNLSADEAYELAVSLICDSFKQLNIFTHTENIQVLAAKPQSPRIMRHTAGGRPTAQSAAVGTAASAHNRSKNYIIPNGSPCDFLIRLGVMDSNGKVFDRSYSKFRQINRYLEIVEDVFPYLPADKTLKIIDFGCGKAYLTFALYYYLKILKNRDVEIIGLDLKEDVIDFCEKVASDLGYNELKFLKGDIADYSDDCADMVVTLHACDTATDYALINSVAWNTKVIISVPCCQHELFKQIKNELHKPILKHGILKDRFTEYLTDGLRGLMLEAAGYDVSMIEFTSLEHTARNIMIKAVKTNAAGAYAKKKCEAAQQQYDALCDFYAVSPTIGKLSETK